MVERQAGEAKSDPEKWRAVQIQMDERGKQQRGVPRAKDPSRYPLACRLIDLTDGCGSILYARTNQKRAVSLAGSEFIRRFLLHVLPSGFKRIRHYGLLSPAHKTKRLSQARVALGVPIPESLVIESVAQFMQRVAQIDLNVCPHCCHGHFVVCAVLAPLRAPRAVSRGPP